MKKKMFIAGMSLVVALVLLATASFAWFTVSTSPEVSATNLAVYTDRTLLLAPDKNGQPGEFSQYISLSANFAGLAPLRPVSTVDGVNWFLPAYDTQSGGLAPVSEFILDNTLEHANVRVTDESGTVLSGDAYNSQERKGYYVYTDIWMKTEEEAGAYVRLSVPHTYGTAEERQAGDTSEFGLDSEELTRAVYGTYVLGEPELDSTDNTKLAARTEQPETAIRVGFLVYQNEETLETGSDGETLPFAIYEPNAGQRAGALGMEMNYVVPNEDGDQTNTKQSYIVGSNAQSGVVAEGNYVITQPIALGEDGKGTLGSIDPANLIIQTASEWDETETVLTLSGERENGNTRPNSNDIATFGQFIKTDDRFAIAPDATQTEAISIEGSDESDYAGSRILVTLKKDTPIRVRIFIWIEGQDVDCWNDIAAGTFRINLELAGETIPKEEEEEEEETTLAILKGYGTDGNSADGWFDSVEATWMRDAIEEIEFTDVEPSTYDAYWNAGQSEGEKPINAYRSGSKIFIVVPEGEEKIYLPEDSSMIFGGCYGLKYITGLEYVDTSCVETMDCMFYKADNLTELDVTGFDTAAVTSMNSTFYGCKSLSVLDLSSFDTAQVTDMQDMFRFCEELTTILATESFDTSKANAEDTVFEYNEKLVGGNGTVYNESNVTKEYARIDKPGKPGYFTDIAAKSSEDESDIICTLKGYGTNGNSSDGWYDKTTTGYIRDYVTALEFTTVKPTAGTYTCSWNAGQEDGAAAIMAYANADKKVTIVVPEGAEAIKLPSNCGSLFSYLRECESITGLELLDASGVTDMRGMFRYCLSITELDLSSWNTANVTNMLSTFDTCTSLTDLNLTGFDTSGVTNMWRVFGECTSLTELDLSSFDTSSVTNMKNFFYNDQVLKTVYVSDKWSTEAVTASDAMFRETYAIVGGNGTTRASSSVTDATYARIDTVATPGYFTDIADKKSEGEPVIIGTLKGYGTDGSSSDGWFDGSVAKITRSQVTEITFTKSTPTLYEKTWNAGTTTGAKAINAYRRGTKIYIVLPEGADKISLPEDSGLLFGNMNNCTSISGLEYVDTSAVTDMSTMFAADMKLKSPDLSGFNTSSVTDMSGMFASGMNLQSLDLSSFDTSSVTVMDGMFYQCSTLQQIYVGDGWNMSAVEQAGSMFYNCFKLVGENGTGYDTNNVDATYAHIDEPGNPGYFSEKPQYSVEDLTMLPISSWIFDQGYMRGGVVSVTFSRTEPASYNKTWRVDGGSGPVGLTAYGIGDGTNLVSIVIVLPQGADKLYFPADSSGMFASMTRLETIDGMELVDISYVKDMSGMFMDTDELTSLDLSSWDTSGVTDMSNMFDHATGTYAIFVSDKWSTKSVTDSSNMFNRCDNVTGGNGTDYNTAHKDAEYARIDKDGQPGYFTDVVDKL